MLTNAVETKYSLDENDRGLHFYTANTSTGAGWANYGQKVLFGTMMGSFGSILNKFPSRISQARGMNWTSRYNFLSLTHLPLHISLPGVSTLFEGISNKVEDTLGGEKINLKDGKQQ